MSLKRVERHKNGSIYIKFKIFECEWCGKEIPESNPRVGEGEEHWHVDCAYIRGLISEEEAIKMLCFAPADYLAVTPEQKVALCEGAPPKCHPNYHTRKNFKSLSQNKDFREKVLQKYGYECVNCGSGEDLEIDHIVPISREGTNDLENLQVLCGPCNSSKSDKTMQEWGGEKR